MAAPVPEDVLARAAALDVETRVDAIGSLRALATPAAWNLVLALLQRDVDPRVRAAAARALGASHDTDALSFPVIGKEVLQADAEHQSDAQ